MSADSDRLPVGLLTGFLGSGKTTLLRRWLHGDATSATAVLINEFGAVGLDHLLVGDVQADTVLLDNGCVCCAIRQNLKAALLRQLERRQSGELPPYRRVIIETTGLAAPGPLIATLLADAQLSRYFRLAFVCTVVDVQQAVRQRQRYPEWAAQVAAADALCLSKTDLVYTQQSDELRRTLAASNPLAQVLNAANADVPWHLAARRRGAAHWQLRAAAGSLPRRERPVTAPAGKHPPRDAAEHSAVQAAVLEFDHPLNWLTLTLWLTLLQHRYGDRILRLKGLLNVVAEGGDDGQPTVLHGIGHLMYPPEHLRQWPDGERRSTLILITDGLDKTQLRASWESVERVCNGGGAA